MKGRGTIRGGASKKGRGIKEGRDTKERSRHSVEGG